MADLHPPVRLPVDVPAAAAAMETMPTTHLPSEAVQPQQAPQTLRLAPQDGATNGWCGANLELHPRQARWFVCRWVVHSAKSIVLQPPQ